MENFFHEQDVGLDDFNQTGNLFFFEHLFLRRQKLLFTWDVQRQPSTLPNLCTKANHDPGGVKIFFEQRGFGLLRE
jgi:hypothetical protein